MPSNNRTRTKNVSINVIIGIICQVVTLIMNFVLRTVYIKSLGQNYLGVNGLFSNILSVLSFAELGIGNALVFSMYKPLANSNQKKLAALMHLYKRVYLVIGIFIACCGICVIPFLPFIIHDTPDIPENINLLYVLFLSNTVVSYFLTYKKSIIIADQKNYVVLIINETVKILQKVVQIWVLFKLHNYVMFLVLEILGTVLVNGIASIVADKMFPYLKESQETLSKKETQDIFLNVKGLAAYKFGNVILDGTDSILISILDSVANVGIVSNYVLINSSCSALLSKIKDSFTASVGNLNATESATKQENIFYKILFITAWIYGFASVGLINVANPLIKCWLGPEYVLNDWIYVVIIIGFYIDNMNYTSEAYRNTLGFFKDGKFAPLIAAVVNLALSVALYFWFGLIGIFIATPIARFFTIGIVDPYFIYKKKFNKPLVQYFIVYFKYFIINVFLCFLCYLVCNSLCGNSWNYVFIRIVIVTIIYNMGMLLFFWKNEACQDIKNRIKKLTRK